MPKKRYDEEENISRHATTNEECCEEMEKKYGWKLKRIEESDDSFFDVDCVFDGKTEFPKTYKEND